MTDTRTDIALPYDAATKARLDRLGRLYDIYGDGAARIRLAEAAKDPAFVRAVKRLSRLEVNGTNRSEDDQGGK